MNPHPLPAPAPYLRACLAGASLCLAAALPSESRTVRMAIVAGHNRGEAQDPVLKYAESDADRFASLLSQIGGLEENNLFLLKAPTPKLVRYAFSELTSKARDLQAGDEAIFYFYYSGHGDRDKLKLGGQGFALSELRALIDSLPAKVRIGVFDACQSGSITRLKGGKAVKPLILEQETNGKGTILITSSSEDESAQESENLKGSFFTHHWLSGLRGPADFSGDKHVSLMEAYQYAFQKTVVNTEGTTGGIQHPNARFQVDVEGDIVLTDLASGDGGIRFPPEVTGHFLVVDKASVIMAEFQKEPEREVFLALGPGNYMIYKQSGKSLTHAEAAIAMGQITVFDEKGLKRGTLYASVGKGGMESSAAGQERTNAQRRPFGISVGFQNDRNFAIQAGFNYALFRRFGLDLRLGYQNPFLASQQLALSARPGLEVHHFASANVQFMGRLAYAAAWQPGYVQEKFLVNLPCADTTATELCASFQYSDSYVQKYMQWGEFHVGVRYWAMPTLSFDVLAGLEYGDPVPFWDRSMLRTQPVTLGLTWHL